MLQIDSRGAEFGGEEVTGCAHVVVRGIDDEGAREVAEFVATRECEAMAQ